MQTLRVTIKFVGSYAYVDFHHRTRACPSYKNKVRSNCGLENIIKSSNPLIARLSLRNAHAPRSGWHLPALLHAIRQTLTYSTGVAVTSQVLCTSITLNKGYIFIYELFNCKRCYLPYSNAFAHACQHLIVIYFISAFNIGGGGIAFYGG